MQKLETTEVEAIFGKIRAPIGDLITDQIVRFGAHTRNELAMVLSMVDPGDCIMDIGAHIGTFTLPLAQKAGEAGMVIAIEQNSEYFSLLRENVHSNGLRSRVALVETAVSDGPLNLVEVRIEGNTGASYLVKGGSSDQIRTVRIDALHNLFLGDRKVDLIKIDVEGMELSALNSASSTINRFRPIIYMEAAEAQLKRHGVSFDDIEKWLKQLDYRFFRNVGERNSTNDEWRAIELGSIADGGAFFDLLAIPSGHSKIGRISNKLSDGAKPKRAVVYVAWGQQHIEEACNSSRSAEFLGLDRILITNSSSRAWVNDELFERIIEHEFRLPGQLAKTEMFAVLPEEYNSFVFLDTDTWVLLDIEQGFDRAERYGIAVAQAAHYGLEHFWGFSVVLNDVGFESKEILQYNSGVIFFARRPEAWAVLTKWFELCRDATGNVKAWGDQPYLTLAMELLNFNPYALSTAYNYRNFGELVSGRIRIWHSRFDPPEDVNDFDKPWPPRRFRNSIKLLD